MLRLVSFCRSLYCDSMTEAFIGYEFNQRFYGDSEKRQVLLDGQPLPIALTGMEYDILEFFLQHPKKLFKREAVEPLKKHHRGRHPLDDYLSKIRSKLGLRPNELFVLTRSVGYTLDANVRPISASDNQEGGDIFKASELHFNTHTVDSMRESLKQSLQALEINPHGLADAHITAAYDYINLSQAAYAAEIPIKVMDHARWHAAEALKEPSTLSAAQGVLGLISLIYDYDWKESEKQLKEALALDPNDVATLLSYAHLRVSSGRFQEGIQSIETAVRIDSTDRIVHASMGWMHLFAGDVEEAIELGEKTKYLYPDLPPAYVILGWAYEAAGLHDAARKHYETSLEKEYSPAALASLGHLLGKLGQRPEALRTLKELDLQRKRGLTSYVPGYCRALVYAGLNEVDKCLKALDDAYVQKCDWLIHLSVERRWDPVRNEPGFKRLVEKIGIPRNG